MNVVVDILVNNIVVEYFLTICAQQNYQSSSYIFIITWCDGLNHTNIHFKIKKINKF